MKRVATSTPNAMPTARLPPACATGRACHRPVNEPLDNYKYPDGIAVTLLAQRDHRSGTPLPTGAAPSELVSERL